MEDEDEDDLLDEDDRHVIDMALQLLPQSKANTTESTTTTNSQHNSTDMTPTMLRTWTPTSLNASNLCMPSTPSNFLHIKILLPSTSQQCSKQSYNSSAIPDDHPPSATFNAASSVTPQFHIITLTTFSTISMH